MSKFRVKYFYLATGMEGRSDESDYGLVEAKDAEDAKEIVALRRFPEDIMYGPDKLYSTRQFFFSCLIATEVD